MSSDTTRSLSSGGLSWLGLSSLSGGLSLLNELRKKLLVLGGVLSGFLGFGDSGVLHGLLSAEALLSNESLDLWSLPEGLVSSLDSSVANVLAWVILLLVKVEEGDDVRLSLLLESVWTLNIGNTSDVLLSLLDNTEGNNGKIWSADATSD